MYVLKAGFTYKRIERETQSVNFAFASKRIPVCFFQARKALSLWIGGGFYIFLPSSCTASGARVTGDAVVYGDVIEKDVTVPAFPLSSYQTP